MNKNCGTCKWLDVPPGKDGTVKPVAGRTYKCLVPLPEAPKYPESITSAYSYKPMVDAQKVFMPPILGEKCPCWEGR